MKKRREKGYGWERGDEWGKVGGEASGSGRMGWMWETFEIEKHQTPKCRGALGSGQNLGLVGLRYSNPSFLSQVKI